MSITIVRSVFVVDFAHKKKEMDVSEKDKNKFVYKRKRIVCKDTGEICSGKDYLNTKHWRKLRNVIYNKFQGKCQRCGKAEPSDHMNVHHMTYKRIGKESHSDLMLLCEHCHAIIHGRMADEKGVKRKNYQYFKEKCKRKAHGNKIADAIPAIKADSIESTIRRQDVICVYLELKQGVDEEYISQKYCMDCNTIRKIGQRKGKYGRVIRQYELMHDMD